MANIRINSLPSDDTPTQNDVLPIDGSTTRKATIKQVAEIGRPVASQAEAETGTDPSKAMTPLTVKQSIASEVGVSLASKAQGDLADSAVQPNDLATVATSGEYDDLSNKPDLATVATSGDYDDLANLPSLGTAAATDASAYATAAQGGKADTAVQPEEIGDLAAKDKVSISDIDATGTAGSGTYLRGDGTWDDAVSDAEAAADRAEAAAASVDLPPIDIADAGRVLTVKPDGTGYVARPTVVDTLTDLSALTAADVRPGTSVELRFGDTYGGGGPRDFLAMAGTAMDNFGISSVDNVIVENDAGDMTFVRADWLDRNEVNLLWFAPPLDGTSDCATAITAWYTTVNALAALRGRCQAVVPDIGEMFQTSAPVLMGSGFILTGGGELACHDSMPQNTNLLRTLSLSAGLNVYAQEYIELNNIRLNGRDRNQTGQRQGLVRIFSTRRVVIGDNVEAYNQQSHLLAFAGNGSLSMAGDNIHLHHWGHPSNGIAITGAADNGSGKIRLTVTSTATMATGDLRYVNAVSGVTNANSTSGNGGDPWVVTVIDETHVDLEGSTFSGVFSGSSGKISSGVDGGSAIICLPNPIDLTRCKDVQIGPGVFIHDGNWNGIQMNAVGFIINGVQIRNTHETAIFARQQSSDSRSSDAIITNCNIIGVQRAYIDANGITAGGVRTVITDNLVQNCDYAGISAVSEEFDMTIEGNSVYNGNMDPVAFPSGGGIVLRDAIAGGGPRYVRIRNNVVFDAQVTKTATAGIRAFSQSPGTAMNDVEIEDNTLTGSAAVAGNELVIDPSAVGVRWRVRNNMGAPDLYDIASRTLQNNAGGNLSLAARDSGKLFMNLAATSEFRPTLPLVAAGLRFGFYVADPDGIAVLAAGTNRIRVGTSVSSPGGSIASSTPGDVIWLFSDGSAWYAEQWAGTWTTA